ncbi:unnamed protein product [Gadus morhua 'NCC']
MRNEQCNLCCCGRRGCDSEMVRSAACRQRVTLAPHDVRTHHSALSKFRASRGSLSRHKSFPRLSGLWRRWSDEASRSRISAGVREVTAGPSRLWNPSPDGS